MECTQQSNYITVKDYNWYFVINNVLLHRCFKKQSCNPLDPALQNTVQIL